MIEETIKSLLELPKPTVWIDGVAFGSVDLITIARAYDENVLAPQRALAKYQVYIEWMKRLSRDLTTKMPVCNCGSVIPEPYLEPEKRPEFLKWCEEHYVHLGPSLHIVKPCPHRDVLNSECVLPLGHEGDHQMVNGTNEANDDDQSENARTVRAMTNDPTGDIQEFIAAYHELRKFTLQFEDVFERSHMIYLKACKLLEESEKKIANEPVTAEVIEINNAFFNSTAYPDQD